MMNSNSDSALESIDLVLYLIIACRVIEAVNSLLIKRWLNNIRIDIIKFIRLVRQRNVFLQTDEATGQVSIKAKDGKAFGDAEDLKDFDTFNKAVIIRKHLGYTTFSAESYVVENLWEIIVKGNGSDCLTGIDQYMQKEYLYGANSLLDQSIGGIINDFYDDDFDCESERAPFIMKSERHNS